MIPIERSFCTPNYVHRVSYFAFSADLKRSQTFSAESSNPRAGRLLSTTPAISETYQIPPQSFPKPEARGSSPLGRSFNCLSVLVLRWLVVLGVGGLYTGLYTVSGELMRG